MHRVHEGNPPLAVNTPFTVNPTGPSDYVRADLLCLAVQGLLLSCLQLCLVSDLKAGGNPADALSPLIHGWAQGLHHQHSNINNIDNNNKKNDKNLRGQP